MNSSKDLGGTDTHCHASESCVNELGEAHSLSEAFTNDCALRTTIHECLNPMIIDLASNVKHCDVSKELWEVLLHHVVLLIDQVLSDFLFNLLLCLNVIWIRVHEPVLFLHLLSLSFQLILESLTHYLLEFDVIISRYSITELWVLVQYVMQFIWIAKIVSLKFHCLIMNLLSLLVLKYLVKEVGSSCASLDGWKLNLLFRQVSEETVKQIGIIWVSSLSTCRRWHSESLRGSGHSALLLQLLCTS